MSGGRAKQPFVDDLRPRLRREISIGRLKPTPGITDEWRRPTAPAGGLSVGDIDGKITGEQRGKQDSAQKLTTAVPQGELVGASGD
jgi:hypothetical protein